MCCLALVAGFIGPRVALFVWWVFGDKVDAAFSSWIWPLLGLIFLPWTTLMFVLVDAPVGGIHVAGWILVGLGFVLDLSSYAQSRAYRSSEFA